jgi:glyoxylase-like metal-dependent hydrolase (beta-lactamase superfamily II)
MLVRTTAAALLTLAIGLLGAMPAAAQPDPARLLLLGAAEAMGGLERLRGIDNFVLTGFGQAMNQQGGSRVTGHPMAPGKYQAVHAAERTFDLVNARALNRDRRAFLFPFAATFGQSWSQSNQLQTGVAMLDHPLPALLEALDPETALGPVRIEDGLSVVEFTPARGDTLWLALDPATSLPAWVRWISSSSALGDVTNTAWFTGYLPFDGVRLPIGLTATIDWRDTVVSEFHVDAYRLNVDELPAFPAGPGGGGAGGAGPGGGGGGAPGASATPIADGVWDVRVGENGGAVIEFDDHLTMFEAYGNEAATFARIDLANTLVPGKEVTEVIVTHHHFDHAGGLRAAVARGLTVIAQRGNEAIFREMVARPAPVYPDALARSPRPLEFMPVDEHLVLEDATARVDVYHAIGHLHMAEAVFAYVPEHRIFLEGDFSTYNWDWHWWGDAYLDNVEQYGLDPAINVPVHGMVTSFDETIAAIEEQVERARAFCAESEARGVYPAGCPVQFSR